MLNAGRFHTDAGGSTAAVGVDHFARVDVLDFAAAARGATAAAALQAANHEVGTTQPVAEVAAAIDPMPLIVDASQTRGQARSEWSVLTADARTWGAGPGVGVLAVRTGSAWQSPYPDDEREPPGRAQCPGHRWRQRRPCGRCSRPGHDDAARMRAQIDRIRAGGGGDRP